MRTITKRQIIHEIARRRGMDPKDVQRIVVEFLHTVTENLVEGNRFEFRDFGIFEVVERKSKIGRNPKSPETPILIPARKGVKFSPGRKLKTLISSSV
ncbi:HU family DNA-binding protein [Simkania negevensis]|uniref:Putative DNA-binding protein HU n=1 Tax=Simkania negevensis (strain ATCC VR-1471 / DSM 27360 / Z) TaxID=331113 RepID=F8L300_SIMNZ|nr:HU family DNA-binding protein [Simkania negevensis]MCB1073608.1 HU family DNA-binding protein [Chlamydiia bacterium]CCB87846.1 putative DNA-binding protein HU [Simkania negevensis Z]